MYLFTKNQPFTRLQYFVMTSAKKPRHEVHHLLRIVYFETLFYLRESEITLKPKDSL
jgi:hypothetical protein